MAAELKKCSKCGLEKSLDDFRRDLNRPDGHRAHCKSCANFYDAEYKKTVSIERIQKWSSNYRSKNKRKIIERQRIERYKNPERTRAWNILNKAIKRSKIMKQPCSVCGSKDAEAHHHDYLLPYDIQWLCHRHHKELHKNLSKSNKRKQALEVSDESIV